MSVVILVAVLALMGLVVAYAIKFSVTLARIEQKVDNFILDETSERNTLKRYRDDIAAETLHLTQLAERFAVDMARSRVSMSGVGKRLYELATEQGITQ